MYITWNEYGLTVYIGLCCRA